MLKRLAQKIAQKHMELRYPQQPLRLQPDYGERNAADFLGENVVQVNMGIKPLKGGPGNVKDEVIADDFEADFFGDDIDAEEIEGFEIVDDMGLDRVSEFMKGSRFHSGPQGKKEFEQWKKDNPEAAETFDEQTEINKDVVKNRAKAMNSDDFQELDSEQKELEEKLEEIQEGKEEIVEEAGKTARYEIIDDIGLGRTASDYSSLIRKVERELRGTPLSVELDSDYDGTDLLIQWGSWDVYDLDDYEGYEEDEMEEETEGMIEREELSDLLSDIYNLVKRNHKGFVERGTSDISEGVYRIRIHDDNIRSAKDHEESGSYMSRQNLREMGDMADFIVDDIGNEGLDDWVEDKISQAYSKLNDVARYRGYRDDHPHGEDDEVIRFADDEIIDDMGIMAEFDKYSRYSRGEKGQEEYAKAREEGNVPEEFLEYEGAVTSPGEAPDPSIIEDNKEEMGKEARYYDIIDDLEW